MRRRDFVAALGAAVWPVSAVGQQRKTYRLSIATFASTRAEISETTGRSHYRALHKELRRLGYADGRNLEITIHSTGGKSGQVPALVLEVLSLQPDVIFVADPTLAHSLKAATSNVPIVTVVTDPIATGLADSLARPGGNVTGFSIDPGADIIGKRIELLREVVPTAKRMAWLAARRVWESGVGRVIRDASERAGMPMVGALLESPTDEQEYRRVFAAMAADAVDCLQVSALVENMVYRDLVVSLCAAAICQRSIFFGQMRSPEG